MQAVRPGVVLHRRPSRPDELVLAGGGEVFRLPLAPSAVSRQAVLVRALPELVPRVPVALAPPRYVGVMADGTTPFTAERRLPGVRPDALEGIAVGQLEGVVEALAAVPVREAEQWGVPLRIASHGPGPDADEVRAARDRAVLRHAALSVRPDRPVPSHVLDALLADPRTGLLTGVVDWHLVLGQPLT